MAFPIIGFKNINMEKLLNIDSNTFNALQIFKRDFRSQATVDNKIVTKEGFSLFGIMNHTRSQVGFRMLKQWFLQPLADFNKIVERQEAISLLKDPMHEMTLNSIRNHIRQLKSASKLSQKIKCSTLTASDWNQLQKAQQF
uniref:MutS protein homolog 5 (Trinotate prediction) n=1 Tax=Myxobolus squamalis TaxID=59785 RepID=A0A6B2G029_MYXSQ